MKIALLTDTHFGIRDDSQLFYKYFDKFYDKLFFPYLDENGITEIIHCGDLADRRKYINYLTKNQLHKNLIVPMRNRGIKGKFIVGNHDTTYKDSNEINCMSQLYGSEFEVYSKPTEIELGGMLLLLMPWICKDNEEQSFNMIKNTQAPACFGHLELQGFKMYRELPLLKNGWDPISFQHFEVVGSGHYHHKSSVGNIHYLGAPYQMNWLDFNDQRGFHVFDTETRELHYIQNPYKIFYKIYYDDKDKKHNEVITKSLEEFTGCYVKVIVRNKTNPIWFDKYIDVLEKSDVGDLQVAEDHYNLDLQDDDDIIEGAENTLTLIKNYINSLEMNVNREKVEEKMQKLYVEALNMEK